MDTGHIQARLRCWRFGEVVVDEASCKVQVRHQLVDLQPRVWHLLVLLLNRPGEVCSKEQLLESLWPGVAVSEGSLTNCIAKLRCALEDSERRVVLTAHGLGYRLGVPVSIEFGDRQGSGLQLAVGQSLSGRPDWCLVECLQRGPQSQTWRIERRGGGEQRILRLACDSAAIDELRRERLAFERLREVCGDCAPIMPVLDGRDDEIPAWLETACCTQPSLAQRLSAGGRRASVTLSTRLGWAAMTAGAVESAHRAGVLHENLEAGHVWFHTEDDGRQQVWLSGWGQSRLPPEGRDSLTLRRRAGDRPGDIHALGVMLYQCIVGDLRRSPESGWEHGVDHPGLRRLIGQALLSPYGTASLPAAEFAEQLRAVIATLRLQDPPPKNRVRLARTQHSRSAPE